MVDDVAGGGAFTGVRPNAGGVDSADDRDDLALIGESEALHKDPTTDSVCEGTKCAAKRVPGSGEARAVKSGETW